MPVRNAPHFTPSPACHQGVYARLRRAMGGWGGGTPTGSDPPQRPLTAPNPGLPPCRATLSPHAGRGAPNQPQPRQERTAFHPLSRLRGRVGRGHPHKLRLAETPPHQAALGFPPVPRRPLPARGARNAAPAACRTRRLQPASPPAPTSLDTPHPASVNGRTCRPAHDPCGRSRRHPAAGLESAPFRWFKADPNRFRGRSSAGRAPRSQ